MKQNEPQWERPRKLSAHYFTYSTLSNIISYCDIDTVIELLNIGSGFVFNSTLLSIQANFGIQRQKLVASASFWDDLLKNEVFASYDAATLVEPLRQIREEKSNCMLDIF